MNLSAETEILIKLLSDPGAWVCYNDIAMVHKNGLHFVCYRLGSTFMVAAHRDGAFLRVPKQDLETLAVGHFFPTRKLVEAREAAEKVQASKELLEKLQKEVRHL